MIEIASHGYVCISIADTNGAGVYTELPDGTPVPFTEVMNPAEGRFNLETTKEITQARVD